MITMKDIVREGHPTLRLVAKEVEFPLSKEVIGTANDMMEFLVNSQDEELAEKYQLRAGVGLAAPQINQSIRLIAVHIPGIEEDSEEPMLSDMMVNPKIISHSVQSACLAEGEGCLSVDRDVPGYVPRHSRITVQYYDLAGKKHKARLKNYAAMVIQHEIDHLDGVMFYDRINEENPFDLEEGVNVIS